LRDTRIHSTRVKLTYWQLSFGYVLWSHNGQFFTLIIITPSILWPAQRILGNKAFFFHFFWQKKVVWLHFFEKARDQRGNLGVMDLFKLLMKFRSDKRMFLSGLIILVAIFTKLESDKNCAIKYFSWALRSSRFILNIGSMEFKDCFCSLTDTISLWR